MTNPHSVTTCNILNCQQCESYKAAQQELAENDASRIKNFVNNADAISNHLGNAAYSLTLFIKHIPPVAFNLMNGVPWLNMIFMIVGGMFRIASAIFVKDRTNKNDDQKKRNIAYVVGLTILGLATMSFGIAGLVIFSLYTSLVLMAVSAGIDLISSVFDLIKTTDDYFTEPKKADDDAKKKQLQLKHGLKVYLRLPSILINIAALIGCTLLLIAPPVGAAILIGTAIATIAYIVADKRGYNPIKHLYEKYKGYKEEPDPAEPLTNNAKMTAKLKIQTIPEPRVTPEKSPWAPQKKQSFRALVSYAIKSLFSPLPRSTLGSPTSRPRRSNTSSL